MWALRAGPPAPPPRDPPAAAVKPAPAVRPPFEDPLAFTPSARTIKGIIAACTATVLGVALALLISGGDEQPGPATTATTPAAAVVTGSSEPQARPPRRVRGAVRLKPAVSPTERELGAFAMASKIVQRPAQIGVQATPRPDQDVEVLVDLTCALGDGRPATPDHEYMLRGEYRRVPVPSGATDCFVQASARLEDSGSVAVTIFGYQRSG